MDVDDASQVATRMSEALSTAPTRQAAAAAAATIAGGTLSSSVSVPQFAARISRELSTEAAAAIAEVEKTAARAHEKVSE